MYGIAISCGFQDDDGLHLGYSHAPSEVVQSEYMSINSYDTNWPGVWDGISVDYSENQYYIIYATYVEALPEDAEDQPVEKNFGSGTTIFGGTTVQ